MDRVLEIISNFIDIKSFSILRLVLAVVILAIFLSLRGVFSSLIIKLFLPKEKKKTNTKNNSFYRPLRLFFMSLGIYLSILTLRPTVMFSSILSKCFRIIIILICTYSIANLVSVGSRFERTLKLKMNKANDSLIKMICKGLKVLVYLVGAVILISELGYNISGLIAGLGIGGVAIALAAQDTASNIIGALMILLDKPFDVGDWIKVGDTEGSVEEFTFRSTRIRESANSIVAIPNSTIVNSSITNWSRLQKRRILMDIVLELDTPLKKIADVQNDILIFLENEPNVITDSAYVKFNEIKDNGYNLKVFCYTPIINYVDYLSYMEKVNFKIMSILNTHKVSMAYNSQTIYLKK